MSRLRLHVVTLGVADFARSVRFYQDLGFARRMQETGDAIAFFDAGGMIVSLFRWDRLADDAHVPAAPRPQAFRGVTLASMCRTEKEVDALMSKALAAGDPAQARAEDGLRRLFGLLRRSGRSRLGSGARAGIQVYLDRAGDLAGVGRHQHDGTGSSAGRSARATSP